MILPKIMMMMSILIGHSLRHTEETFVCSRKKHLHVFVHYKLLIAAVASPCFEILCISCAIAVFAAPLGDIE